MLPLNVEAAICSPAICSTVLPPIVRVSAETVVATKLAVLETFKFVKLPVAAVMVSTDKVAADT